MIEINTVTLTGRLVRDPLIYPNETGIGLALFTISVSRDYVDKAGKVQTETAYVPCKAFRSCASALSRRAKGDSLIVSGRLKSETWEKDGTVHWQLSLICLSVLPFKPVPEASSPTCSKSDGGGDDEGEPPF